MALSKKQKSFINEYFLDFNATRAAERAGYAGDDNTLAVTGSRLLRTDKVSEAIQARMTENAMTADEALSRLADHARGNMGDFISVDGRGDAFLNLRYASDTGRLNLIKKFTRTETVKETETGEIILNRRVNIELYDAQSALEKIAKAHGVFNNDRGSEGDPVHNVHYSLEEWKEKQQANHEQAAEAMALIEDNDA